MVLCYDTIKTFYIFSYAQTNRSIKAKKADALELHKKSGEFCDKAMGYLNEDFKSWITPLEAMRSSRIPPKWGRIGCTPFTTMAISKNYFTHAHDDPNDSGMGFIMWFVRGKTF